MPRGQARFFTYGPFRGMRLAFENTDRRYAFRTVNYLAREGRLDRRPGEDIQAVTAGGNNVVQGEWWFHKKDGTNLDVVVVGGELWTRDADGNFTKKVTTANLTTASITLSSTARVRMCTFSNKVVFTDGVNTPFVWDGTSGAGGLTKLTNAPVAYGHPTVYYGKLFFVKNTERSTLVWSEEGDPNTGYEAGGFNNAWTLAQTAEVGSIIRIYGLNDGLYYWRGSSIGAIRGAVTTDFKNDGVHDGVSGVVGTLATDSVLWSNQRLWFVDRNGRPYRLQPGGEPEPLWEQLGAVFTGIEKPGDLYRLNNALSQAAEVMVAAFDEVGGVVFAYGGATNYATFYVLDVDSGECIGEMQFSTGSGNIHFVGNGAASEGSVVAARPVLTLSYMQGTTEPRQLVLPMLSGFHQYAAGAKDGIIMLPPCGGDEAGGESPFTEWRWDRAEVLVEAPGGANQPYSVQLRLANNEEAMGDTPAGINVPGGGTIAYNARASHAETRTVYQLQRRSRWLRPCVALALTDTSPTGQSGGLALRSLRLVAKPVAAFSRADPVTPV
jgi:hypothetical protein